MELIITCFNPKVQIWNVASGALLQCMEGPEGEMTLSVKLISLLIDPLVITCCLDVEFATWHPKGNAVLAGSRDGTAWMWLSHNGQCVQVQSNVLTSHIPSQR